MPGFGESGEPQSSWGVDDFADCVLEFIQFCGIQKAILLGHSHGGRVSIKIANRQSLPFELTKLVHGKEEADKADAAAKAIFAGGGNSDDMPSTTIAAADLTDGKIGILTLLVKCGLCPSNGEARRLVTQNGIAVNGEKFTDPKGLVDLSEPVVIKKGKKIFHKAIAE